MISNDKQILRHFYTVRYLSILVLVLVSDVDIAYMFNIVLNGPFSHCVRTGYQCRTACRKIDWKRNDI